MPNEKFPRKISEEYEDLINETDKFNKIDRTINRSHSVPPSHAEDKDPLLDHIRRKKSVGGGTELSVANITKALAEERTKKLESQKITMVEDEIVHSFSS